MVLEAWERSDEALHSAEAVLNNVIKGWVRLQLQVIMVCLFLALPAQAFEVEELSVWRAAPEWESPVPRTSDFSKTVPLNTGKGGPNVKTPSKQGGNWNLSSNCDTLN